MNSVQRRAIDRSLNTKRARALANSSKFLAAATELVEENGRLDFTVRSLLARSKLSLRTFYQHYESKDELILALYEDLMRQFIDDLRADVMAPKKPLDQLERFCRSFLDRAAESMSVGGRVLTIYHLNLEIERPSDIVKSLEPQMNLLIEILESCVEAGVVRQDLNPAQMALLLSTTLMSQAQMAAFRAGVGGLTLSSDDIWRWCLSAIGAVQSTSRRSPAKPAPRGPAKSTARRPAKKPAKRAARSA
jgi:AcrR family transcriptional regulator